MEHHAIRRASRPSIRASRAHAARPWALAGLVAAGWNVSCWGLSGEHDRSGPALPEPEVEVVSSCGASTTLSDSITVSSQAELEALAGCEHLESLTISGVHDLRPLSSLQTVNGMLQISGSEDDAQPLESFEGLEAVRAVGSLVLRGVTPLTLHGFEGLVEARSVEISGTQLESLAGLSAVENLWSLSLASNSRLQSLDGVRFPGDSVGELNFGENPVLTDLDALSNLSTAGTLTLAFTTLGNLESLSGLTRIDYLDISFSAIENVDALSSLTDLGRANFQSNAALANLNGLSGVRSMESLGVSNCEALQSLALPSLESVQRLSVHGNGIQSDDAQDGEAAPSVAFNLDLSGLRQAEWIDVYDNAGLTAVALPALGTATDIMIYRNPSLGAVNLATLSEVSTLLVALNPVLAPPAITRSGALTIAFERIASNGDVDAGGVPLGRRLLDPCPWPADTRCDACDIAAGQSDDSSFDMSRQCGQLLCGPGTDALDCSF